MRDVGSTMKKSIAIVTFMILLAGMLAIRDRRCTLDDVTQPTTLILKKKPWKGHVHALAITAEGKIDGTATIAWMSENRAYKKETVSNEFNFIWRTDWYEDQARIRWMPSSVSNGYLKIRYNFECL